jgi:putative SOS response-associated peptidase YedK
VTAPGTSRYDDDMCGRFTLRTNLKLLEAAFDFQAEPEIEPRYNIAPTQQVLTVRLDPENGTRRAQFRKWGLVPSWADSPALGSKMINARAETVASKPAYRNAFKKGRCLILADGFYEWKRVGTKKQPFYITLDTGEPFAFAGLSEHWHRGEQVIDSCAIITTDANELMATIHDRMPVILSPADYGLWLETEFHGESKLASMLKRYPAEEMIATPVSTFVNSPRNQGAECIAEAK